MTTQSTRVRNIIREVKQRMIIFEHNPDRAVLNRIANSQHRDIFYTIRCKKCNKTVTVNPYPHPNEDIVNGDLVDNRCSEPLFDPTEITPEPPF